MQARRDERFGAANRDRNGHSTQAIITVIVALVLAGSAWLLAPGDDDNDSKKPIESVPAPAAPALTPPTPDPGDAIRRAPDIPPATLTAPVTVVAGEPADAGDAGAPEVADETSVAVTDGTEEPAPEARPPEPDPAPTPEEIDADLRSFLADAGADTDPLRRGLNAPFLLDRGVSAIDQIARGYVPQRALNLGRPEGRFEARREGNRYLLDPGSYQRYDRLISAVTTLPPAQLATGFQRFRPLLEQAYGTLGYPADQMDNALVATLDAILAVPAPVGTPELVSKGALWAYADPELEARSDLHKQLLRLGPDNLRRLQRWAGELRRALLP